MSLFALSEMMSLVLKADGTYCSVRDENDAVLSYDAAQKLAAQEAMRDLQTTDQAISYVLYRYDDYHRVTITFDDSKNGVYEIRPLSWTERSPEERIDERRILEVARQDRRMNAVRLFMRLHGCSLRDAILGVANLESPN